MPLIGPGRPKNNGPYDEPGFRVGSDQPDPTNTRVVNYVHEGDL